MRLHAFAANKEAKDVEAKSSPSPPEALAKDGLKMYWKEKNLKSIDGLPGLLSAYASPTTFVIKPSDKWVPDDESLPSTSKSALWGLSWVDLKLFLCFVLGWVACFVWTQFRVGMVLPVQSSVVAKILESL